MDAILRSEMNSDMESTTPIMCGTRTEASSTGLNEEKFNPVGMMETGKPLSVKEKGSQTTSGDAGDFNPLKFGEDVPTAVLTDEDNDSEESVIRVAESCYPADHLVFARCRDWTFGQTKAVEILALDLLKDPDIHWPCPGQDMFAILRFDMVCQVFYIWRDIINGFGADLLQRYQVYEGEFDHVGDHQIALVEELLWEYSHLYKLPKKLQLTPTFWNSLMCSGVFIDAVFHNARRTQFGGLVTHLVARRAPAQEELDIVDRLVMEWTRLGVDGDTVMLEPDAVGPVTRDVTEAPANIMAITGSHQVARNPLYEHVRNESCHSTSVAAQQELFAFASGDTHYYGPSVLILCLFVLMMSSWFWAMVYVASVVFVASFITVNEKIDARGSDLAREDVYTHLINESDEICHQDDVSKALKHILGGISHLTNESGEPSSESEEEKEEDFVLAIATAKARLEAQSARVPAGPERDTFITSSQEQAMYQEVFSAIKEQLGGDSCDENLRQLVNLLICVGTALRHRDMITIVSQATLVINNLPLGSSMRTYLIECFQELLTKPVNEAGDFSGFNPDGIFTANPMFTDLLELFGMVSFSTLVFSSDLVPMEVRKIIAKARKTLKFGTDVDSFIGRVLRLMKHVATTLIACIKERSLEPIYKARGWSISEWSTVVGQYLKDHRIRKNNGYPSPAEFEELKKNGAIHAFWARQIEIHEHAQVVEQLIAIGEDLQKTNGGRLASDVALRTVFVAVFKQLRDRKFELLNDKIGGQYRPQPFTVYQYGLPGAGKSLSVKAFFNNAARAVGIEPSPELAFEYMQGSNFMDGYRPGMQWCNMDDCDQAVIKPGDSNWATAMIMLCNNKPTPIEAARAEDKGTLFANFKAIMFTSNHSSPIGLEHLIHTPEAFWRRIQYKVRVEGRPEYTNAQGALDSAKIPAGVTDVNLYSVFRAREVDGKWGFWQVAGKQKINRQEYQRFLRDTFKVYFQEQTALVTRLNKDSGACLTCGLSNDDHVEPCPVAKIVANEAGVVGDGRMSYVLVICLLLSFDPLGRMMLAVALALWALWLRDPVARQKTFDWLYFGARFYAMRTMTFKDWAVLYSMTRGDPFVVIGKMERFREERFLERIRERKDILLKFAAAMTAGIAVFGAYKILTRKNKDYVLTTEALVRETTRDNTFGSTVANWVTFSKSAEVKSASVIDAGLAKSKTIDPKQLERVIASRYVDVTCGNQRLWGFKYRANTVLMPVHVLCEDRYVGGRTVVIPNDTEIEMTFKCGNMKYSGKVPTDRMNRVSGRDLMLVWVPALYPLDEKLEKIFSPPPSSLSQTLSAYDSGHLIVPGDDETTVKVLEGEERPRYVLVPTETGSRLPTIMYGDCTGKGECGSILVGFAKNSVMPIGMHIAKSVLNGQTLSTAEELVGTELDFCYEELCRKHRAIAPVVLDTAQLKTVGMIDSVSLSQMVNEVGSVEPEVVVVPMPKKRSSYLAAERWRGGTMPVEPVGMMTGFHGTKMKSSIVPSSYHHEVKRFFDAAHPKVDTDYVTPVFTGRKVAGPDGDDYWIDPHTVNFLSMVNKGGSPAMWRRAFKDYMTGAEDLEGWQELRPLVMAEVYLGAKSVVKPDNLKTSMGLPFNRPKRGFIRPIDAETVAVDESLLRHTEFVRKVWRERKLYSPMCNHSLKDEALKRAKLLLCKVRTFSTVSCGVNDAAKRVVGPLLAFILKHRNFFECFGGVDITSTQLDDYMSRLDAVDPQRKRRIAGDYVSYDNKQATEAIMTVADVVEKLAELAGFSDDDRAEAYYSTLSDAYTVRVCQGDIVLLTFANPSGGFKTLMINSIGNSLTLRYAYFSLADELKLEAPLFRQVCPLATVGDDNMGAVREGYEWFNQVGIAEVLKEVGHDYTSSTKSSILEPYTRFEDATFLKRSFWFDAELKRWKAALDLGSIARMLLFTKKSEAGVSLCDQESDIVGTALREMYLHPGTRFEEFRSFVEDFSVKRPGVLPKLRLWTRAELDEKFLKGCLMDWQPVIELRDEVYEHLYNESGPAEPGPTLDLGPVAAMDVVGTVDTIGNNSAETTSASAGNPSDYAEFLQRTILGYTGSLATSNAIYNQIADFYPETKLLTSEFIAKKLSGFNLLRADIEVTFQFNSSSMFKGLYVIAAYPEDAGNYASGTPPTNHYVNANNAFSMLHAVVDLCGSDTVVFKLPFISNVNYADRITTAGLPSWRLVMFCLDPVLNVNNPTVAVTVPYNVYCRFLPENFELVVPFNEAKAKKHAIGSKPAPKAMGRQGTVSTMLGAAKKVSDIVAVLPGAGGIAAVVGQGLSVAQSIADVFGFTKVQKEEDPMVMRPGNFSNVATTDGVFGGQMVGLSGGNNVSIDPSLGGNGEDDSSFMSLFPRPVMIKQFTWLSTTLRQTSLAVIPVMPGYCASGGSLYGLQPTVAGSLGAPFDYWCGDMVYEVMIGCNGLLQGSLQVVWSPYASLDTTNQIGESWNHIFDICEEKSHVFKVHWANRYPMLKNRLLAANPAADGYCNGYLHFRVATPLVSPSTAGASVIVLAAAAGDMQFSVPRATIDDGTVFRKALHLINEADMEETETTDLTAVPRNKTNLATVLGGEAVGSVRQLMQKMSWITSVDLWGAVDGTNRYRSTVYLPFYPRPPAFNLGNAIPEDDLGGVRSASSFSWAGYYSSFYAGIRGSSRLSAVVVSHDVGTPVYSVSASMASGVPAAISSAVIESGLSADFMIDYAGLDMPGALAFGDTVTKQGFQFTFPYYDRYKFRNNFHELSDTELGGAESKWIKLQISHHTQPTIGRNAIHIFQSLGADVALVYYLCPLQVDLSVIS